MTGGNRGQVIFAEIGEQFELTTLGNGKQGAAAAADNLPGFDAAGQHETGLGRDDVETCSLRLQLPQRGARDLHARVGCVAGCRQPVDVGLGNEAAVHELERAVEVGLGEPGIRLGHLDLCRLALDLLRLHRTVHDRQDLTLLDPVAGFDANRTDFTALTDRTDRHFAACRQRAGSIDFTGDRRLAGNDRGDDRDLSRRIAGQVFAATAVQKKPDTDDCRQGNTDDEPDPALGGTFLFEVRVQRVFRSIHLVAFFGFYLGFVIHSVTATAEAFPQGHIDLPLPRSRRITSRSGLHMRQKFVAAAIYLHPVSGNVRSPWSGSGSTNDLVAENTPRAC